MLRLRILLIPAFLLFFSETAMSQKKETTFSIFLGNDKVPEMGQLLRVDSFINSFKAKSMLVKVHGYADYVHTSEYNLRLSQQRAEIVKEHLTVKYPGMVNVLECKGFGEINSSNAGGKNGDAKNRRVDVLVERVVEYRDVDTRPIQIQEPVKEIRSDVPSKTDTVPAEPKVITSNAAKTKSKKITELKKGESMELEGLMFEPGRHFILRESVPVIYKLLKTLEQNPKIRIEIQGHVCCDDGYEDGYDYDSRDRHLSTNRAKAVYDFLVSKGIAEERLSYKGFGHKKPKIFPEKNHFDEQANRRVEILLLDSGD